MRNETPRLPERRRPARNLLPASVPVRPERLGLAPARRPSGPRSWGQCRAAPPAMPRAPSAIAALKISPFMWPGR